MQKFIFDKKNEKTNKYVYSPKKMKKIYNYINNWTFK